MIESRRSFVVGIKTTKLLKNEILFLRKYKPWGIILFSRNPKCDDMLLVRKGQRLSVQPVEEFHFHTVLEMGGIDPKTL